MSIDKIMEGCRRGFDMVFFRGWFIWEEGEEGSRGKLRKKGKRKYEKDKVIFVYMCVCIYMYNICICVCNVFIYYI